jgi:AraC family transcriptional regulator, transcriptional activator of pobA
MKNEIIRLNSIPELHRMLGLEPPAHPLISLMDATEAPIDLSPLPETYTLSFYKVSFITHLSGRFRYGQTYYDFDEGSLLYTAPNQLIGGLAEKNMGNRGYSLVFHPDFLTGYPVAGLIRKYGFFSYTFNEALHLSEKENTTIITLFKIIQEELNASFDELSQDVIISQIELLLNYTKRFYKRQFLTRQTGKRPLLQEVEDVLDQCFHEQNLIHEGIPSVQYLADRLNYSTNYLSDMLRGLTGLNTQQHIHQRLIERAKELLSLSSMSVGEIAFILGFKHPQSFTKLFTAKTAISPLKYRSSFRK